jgi:hypothetical protein
LAFLPSSSGELEALFELLVLVDSTRAHQAPLAAPARTRVRAVEPPLTGRAQRCHVTWSTSLSSTFRAGSYRAVLTIPFAAPTFGAALLGRLSFGLLPLAMLFTVQHATKSFTTAGAVVACFGGTSVLLPLKARLADRYGLALVLPPLSAGAAAAITAMALLARSPVAFLLLGSAAGVCAPPLGPAMRAVWRTSTEGTGLVERAYSLDSVCEETLYLVGPLVVGVLLKVASAATALLATAALLLVGTLAMAGTPPVRQARGLSTPGGWGLGPLRSPGFRSVLATISLTAVGLSIAVTCLAARAQAAGLPSAAAYIEAALAVGSVVGGLVWGRRRHTRGRSVHLAGLTGWLAVGLAVAAGVGSLIALGVVFGIIGLAVAPLFVVSYLAADELAPAHRRTEASTWINTANNIGSAAGASAAGVLVDHVSIAAGFGTGALLTVCAGAGWALSRQRRSSASSQATPPCP